jgi:predicted DNA binding CopG/RHH family protein
MKKLKKIPAFKSEDEEREFWATHDSTQYIDMSKAERVIFPNLKPTTKAISIRMPIHVVEKLKMLANKKDVPYQSLLKMFLSEKIEEELHGAVK